MQLSRGAFLAVVGAAPFLLAITIGLALEFFTITRGNLFYAMLAYASTTIYFVAATILCYSFYLFTRAPRLVLKETSSSMDLGYPTSQFFIPQSIYTQSWRWMSSLLLFTYGFRGAYSLFLLLEVQLPDEADLVVFSFLNLPFVFLVGLTLYTLFSVQNHHIVVRVAFIYGVTFPVLSVLQEVVSIPMLITSSVYVIGQVLIILLDIALVSILYRTIIVNSSYL